MRRRAAHIAAALALIAAPAAAQDLPIAGSCDQTQTIAGTVFSHTRVEWRDSEATVTVSGDSAKGRIIGLRAHDDGFKLSVAYTDAILGPTELVLFSLPDSAPTRYRMGRVSYAELPDGTRAVSSIRGFEDATCAVID